MSTSDPERRLNITNTSRADILIHTFVLREHESPQDALPLRLYLRYYDVPKARSYDDGYILSLKNGSQSSLSSTYEITTGIELFLSEDYGKQDNFVFQVEPSELTIPARKKATQVVTLTPNAPALHCAVLLLHTKPLQRSGSNWYRSDAPLQRVLLRVYGTASLQVSCEALQVELSGLQLPPDSVTRVRKYFRALNVGDGVLSTKVLTEAPWSISTSNNKESRCVPNCPKSPMQLLLELPPRSSVELCAELTIHTHEVLPVPFEEYSPRAITTTQLNFYGLDDGLLLRMPMTVLLEFPKLRVSPPEFDFGPVARGNSRKTYFTVFHTSLLTPMELLITYEGDGVFMVSPKNLNLAPNCSGRFYVMYTASERNAEASGEVTVSAVGLKKPVRVSGVSGASRSSRVSGGSRVSGLAGSWCTAVASLRASSTADRARALPPHDFTDDTVLLPKELPQELNYVQNCAWFKN